MKELFQQYVTYNQWANDRLLAAAEALDNEQLHKEIISSFNSIWLTVFHLWSTETVWWNRLQKGPNITSLEDAFNRDIKEISNAIRKQDQQFVHFVNNLEETYF
ncbi:hypothetical protein F5148DRAFT_1294123 [Russula earlei]|uniref:Uncharacterized protein n=1 Tax=Russula earlei TaxID=71964 RepID=A0ACC0TSX0_9AGAM|nr:hypothetical protein F5148DRAFT_1294123 [Russula earlei]